jgi:predicted TIM-barrel fold metal-dependent hydrolase
VTELEIIDMHTHVQRSEAHGHEMRDYFLTPHLVKPGAPNLGTVDEVRTMMARCGISAVNMLMFTWSGRYLRHGAYALPDAPAEREAAEAELRARVARRVHDNNEWAADTARELAGFGYFAGVNPLVMGADGMVEEVIAQRANGALGVKLVPSDMGIPGEDRRLFPLYEYCVENTIPVLTETGGHSPHCRPAGFTGALREFPQLQLIFAHCGHDKEFGGALDQEFLELAESHEHVYGDTSLRLHEVADRSVSAEDVVALIRRVGPERMLFGTNYVFCDLLPERPGHRPAPEHVDPRFTQVWKSVEVLKTLPLSDDERALLAAGNFRRLTGFGAAAGG